jgi:predicted transcriptional regulator
MGSKGRSVAKRGRPSLDGLDLMEIEGRYLFARYDLGRRLDPPRAPTVAEIAEYMEVSPRTIVAIRARMQTWRRDAAASLGFEPPATSVDDLDKLTVWTAEDDLIRALYAVGRLSNAEAARSLDRDERTLRKWRAKVRRSE